MRASGFSGQASRNTIVSTGLMKHVIVIVAKWLVQRSLQMGENTRFISRGSHSHRTCRTICDRDQNEIKRSRGYLDQNQAIKEGFK